ncbi:MAG: amino acid ABC transporter substrate-binding protein [Azoarcus sp.]|nr:amino acid ABC transporter substrate-binding protein [Azoarcus sp.]
MNTRVATALLTLAAVFCFLPPETANAQEAAIVQNDDPSGDAADTVIEPAETLEKIRQRGVIVIGYRFSSIPFSYQNATHQPTGYAKELCDRVVDTIRKEFRLPKLKIVYQPVPASDRIPMLQNGGIDLECGSTTITAEREKQVDFSLPYFISNIRLLTRKAYQIRDLRDLANKTIVFTAGTTAERIIAEKLDVEHNNITVLQGKTHSDSFLMVRIGRAMAYVIDDTLLVGMIANARDPNAYEIVGPSLSSEHYAIMMRKEDGSLKAAVNEALMRIIVSGEIQELYERWFMRPIPPFGANMNLPMSTELTQFFAQLANARDASKSARGARP